MGTQLDILAHGYYNKARDPGVADLYIVLDYKIMSRRKFYDYKAAIDY